jgi:hypothetical protein
MIGRRSAFLPPVALVLAIGLTACQTPPHAPHPTAAEPPPTGEPPGVAAQVDAATRSSAVALADLQDFQPVPNPEILGYVYPHLSGDLPVPGYYTVFRLRARDHYAELGEGQYDEGPLP